jgi:type II secretory pathway pseudopilin PulG
MRKVSFVKSKKPGFTLLEIVLVMLILVFMIGIFFAVFNVINVSHAKVAVMNDAKDYVELNMEAVTNLIVNSQKIKFTNDPTWSVGVDDANTMSLYFDSYNSLGTSGYLYFVGKGVTSPAPVFSYDQYKVSSGKNKWYINATFAISPTNSKIVIVKLVVMDNSSAPATPYKGGTLIRSIYVPNLVYSSLTDGTTGSVMKCLRTTLG